MGLMLVFMGLMLPTAVAQKQYRVGVSPLVLDIGTIEPGERRIATFFVITSSSNDILVELSANRGVTDFFNRAGYETMINNYSEEDASLWVSFFENPVLLEPTNDDADPGSPKGVRLFQTPGLGRL